MKILELNLKAFGPFTDLPLDFSDGEHGLHIIYGLNESGKSSALRALKSLLYEIPVRSTDDFIHDKNSMRIGGHLRLSDGSELSFTRRKGNKNTILGADETPIGDSALDMYLFGVNEEIFSSVFGIDHNLLVRGAQEILQGEGQVGESLFSAGLGGPGLRRVIKDLEDESDMLFRSKAQTRVINKSINDYNKARKEVSKLSLSGREWSELDKELKKAILDRGKLQGEISKLETDHARLERLRDALPKIAQRKNLLDQLEEMGDPVRLSQEFTNIRRDAMQKLATAQESKKRAESKLLHLNREIEGLSIPYVILDQEETITAFHQRFGTFKQDSEDRIKLESKKRQLEVDIDSILADLPGNLSVEQIQETHPNTAQRTRIRELSSVYPSLINDMERAKKDLRDIRKELKDTEDKLDSLEESRNPVELRQVVTQTRKEGDIEAERARNIKSQTAEEEQALVELAQLGHWTGTLEELEKLAVPSPETVERFDSEFQNIQGEEKTCKDRIADIEDEISRLEQQIDALRRTGKVPSEDDLAAIRDKRDRGWQLIRKNWLKGDDISKEEKEYDLGNPLPEAYEKNVTKADETSDWLRHDADRVAQNAEFTSQREKQVKDLKKRKREEEALLKKTQKAQQGWDKLWQELGIKPLLPREMRLWITKQNKLVQRIEDTRTYYRNINDVDKRISESHTKLNLCLENLNEPTADVKESLDELLDRCQGLIDQIVESNRKRTDLQIAIKKQNSKLTSLEDSQEESADRLSKWRDEWASAIEILNLPANALPEEAIAVISRREELDDKFKETKDKGERIKGIDTRSEHFSNEVTTFIRKYMPDFTDLSVIQKVDQMRARLSKAQQDNVTLKGLQIQIKDQEKIQHEAETIIEIETGKLDDLCEQAGCSDHGELEQIEMRSAEYQDLEKEIANMEERLIELSGGATIEQLIEEVQGIDPDALPAALSDLSNRLNDMETKQTEMDRSIGSKQTLLDQMDGRANAADKEEQAQSILAGMHKDVNRYIRLRMASIILHREIERYREENQGPLLSRASDLFAQLTLQSFVGLKADFSEQTDEQVLVGVRSNDERIGVEGMSDGTRDQLYLSLRIASLEKYLESSEPMPFIVDDILIRFDDKRAGATLKVLGNLSQKTQVLFFTHHSRLVELAKEVKCVSGVKIHELDLQA